ncbi:phage replication initiation protein [Weissella uvarum]|uniref:replication initiation factor domain-containing protein n=1 Tax=Weissella uvarum TaxID=1479233 RepID=UPI001960ECAD|nr:replication initiation factor domain-containing protein [Weissella uvarum]MBM7617362.1 phage replication initiation protein [Weissella uvarum]MCM0595751.1 replication initiation factor domain-containing protein [Weissella uvarum]
MIKAETLKDIRLAKKWSLRQMAAYLDISKSAYERYESGKREIPNPLEERIRNAFINYNGTLAISIDYLRISFENLTAQQVITDVLNMKVVDFSVGGGNEGMLYRESLNYSGFNYIRIFSRDEIDSVGSLLQISGRGCRSFEFILEQQSTDWATFLYNATFKKYGTVTRIDLAINDYCGWFDIGTLIEKAQNNDVKTRFKSPHAIHGNQYSGWTLEFGKRGNVFFRFYEKDKEIASKLGIENYDLGIINRYELQIADTRKAMQLVNDWVIRDQLVESTYGYFNRYLTFYDELPVDKQGNQVQLEFDDRTIWEPWHYFVVNAKAIKFETIPEEISLERSLAWIQRSVAPTLKLIKQVEALDLNHTGLGTVAKFIREAELSPKQEKLFQSIKDQIDSEIKKAQLFEETH